MKLRKRSYVLVFISLIALLMLFLRYTGEQAFKVVPEPYETAEPDTQTDLYTKTQALLAKDEQERSSFFYPLGDPHQALLSRIVLADMAEVSLDVQYYLFHDDDAGRALLSALVDAAKRGVSVRLLLDDMDTKGRDGLFIRLVAATENLSVRVFNPSYLRDIRSVEYLARFPRVTRRMHNKSMTADGIVTVVGGRNVGNEYFDINTEVAFADLDLLGAGAVAPEVSEAFNAYWYSGLAVDVARLADPASDEEFSAYQSSLDKTSLALRQQISDLSPVSMEALAAESVQPFYALSTVIYDQPQKVVTGLYDMSGSVAPAILNLLSSAQQSLLISSPYFIPGNAGLSVLRELRSRDVEITILTNSLAANDVAAVHAGYRNYRRQLLEMGVTLYELKPKGPSASFSLLGSTSSSLHAKTFTIDEKRSFIGSFNLDARSAIHNTEMGIVFDNEAYGAAVSARLQDNLDKVAYRVLVNDQQALEWQEANDDGTSTIHSSEPETTSMERAVVYLMSWLPVEWLL